jgi:hypothetical protein
VCRSTERVEQMLVGVATRRHARSLEPVPATMGSRGTSKSAVSRRFVAKTAAQLAAWQTASLEALDLVGLIIDGVHIGEHFRRLKGYADMPTLVNALRARDRQLGLVTAEEDRQIA